MFLLGLCSVKEIVILNSLIGLQIVSPLHSPQLWKPNNGSGNGT